MFNRRELLCRAANGFGGLALMQMLAQGAAKNGTHHAAKAKAVIFLFMDGGPAQMDTFDPKPRLRADHGKKLPFTPPTTVFNITDQIFGSPYSFKKYGQSGVDVSDIFPHVAGCVDDICLIRSMVADHSEHTAANYFMHSGSGFQGRPSMGSWINYGLGSESDNLPGFIVLESGLVPPGGMDCFASGFLPASYQGTMFRKGEHPVADLVPPPSAVAAQQRKLALLSKMNKGVVARFGEVSEIEATIKNYELAFRMQSAVPELLDLSKESEATKELYGLNEKITEEFGRECLLARRLVERGVRFIELLTPARPGLDRWDQHAGLENGHRVNAQSTDKPIAGLLKDLKSRGLLDSTLVVWGGEFGRTPCAQMPDTPGAASRIGRDHNPYGFTMWMAGGGVKPGMTYGATDEFGYFAIENKVHVHDLHATILHLLGIDHKRLTFRYSGRDMRLTDVHGNVVKDVLA